MTTNPELNACQPCTDLLLARIEVVRPHTAHLVRPSGRMETLIVENIAQLAGNREFLRSWMDHPNQAGATAGCCRDTWSCGIHPWEASAVAVSETVAQKPSPRPDSHPRLSISNSHTPSSVVVPKSKRRVRTTHHCFAVLYAWINVNALYRRVFRSDRPTSLFYITLSVVCAYCTGHTTDIRRTRRSAHLDPGTLGPTESPQASACSIVVTVPAWEMDCALRVPKKPHAGRRKQVRRRASRGREGRKRRACVGKKCLASEWFVSMSSFRAPISFFVRLGTLLTKGRDAPCCICEV